MEPVRIGTRGSKLALAQAEELRQRLIAAHPQLAADGALEVVVIKTTGDQEQTRLLAEIGGKGLFTKEIDDALLERRIDIAVHSLKDVPTWLPEGLELAAVLPREDARDALFSSSGKGLAALPKGVRFGTASLRRQAQVLALRPDIEVVPLRGNVETRLRKLADGEVDATVLAVAGLKRIGAADRIDSVLEPEEMLPAVAQGAIGLQVRSDDPHSKGLVAALDHGPSAVRVRAERACLEVLDGSCRTPIAAYAELDGDRIDLRALIATPDGKQVFRAARRAPAAEAESLGRDVGADLRDQAGEDFFSALEKL